MGRLLRAWLTRWRPVLDIVQRRVRWAEEQAWQTSVQMLAKQRGEYRRELDSARQRIDALTRDIDELKRQVAELEAAARREPPEPAETDPPPEDDEGDPWSDLFCCLDCSSVWLLTSWPGREPVARLAASDGCVTCKAEPEVRLLAAREQVVQAGVADDVAHPPEADNPAERSEVGQKFVADLLQDGVETACAKAGAHVVRELVLDDEADVAKQDQPFFGAVADGLDAIPKALSRGIAWLATDIFGLPDLIGEVAGRVLSGMVMHPLHLHAVAQVCRGIDVVVSEPEAASKSAYSLLEDGMAAAIKRDFDVAEHHSDVAEIDSGLVEQHVDLAEIDSDVAERHVDVAEIDSNVARRRDLDEPFGSFGSM